MDNLQNFQLVDLLLRTNRPRTKLRLKSLTQQQILFLYDVLLDDEVLTFDEAVDFVYNIRDTGVPISVSQSETVQNISTTDTSNEQEQNVGFSDAPDQVDLTVGNMSADSTFDQGYQEGGDLSNFLSRPLEIYKITWTVATPTKFLEVFNPWQLFLDDTRVKNKLETFKLLKATLKIKVVVNGSPYHYGRVFVGVRPTRFDNNATNIDVTDQETNIVYFNNPTVSNKTYNNAMTLYSQRPHGFIDPATNQPLHINWPFFLSSNMIDLTDPDTVDRMGRMEVWELNNLFHNNDATDPLTITFFAWMEDVVLTGLTALAPAVAQSQPTKSKNKKGNSKKSSLNDSNSAKDEYSGNGVVSAPASSVANYMSYFTEVPYIGKYARATQIASGSIANIARLFGFSRPPIVKDVEIFRPQMIGNLANTSGGDPLHKLSLDPKQELSVDPSTVGLPGDDQMSIGYISKIEGLVDQFTWSSNQGPDRIIYSIQVHPRVSPITGTTENPVIWPTPLHFVTVPFEEWTGTIRYRFQFVASAFHRGRIAVVYEPSGQTTAAFDTNTRYMQIIDLAQEKDVTFEVKWSQFSAYLPCDLQVVDGPFTSTGTPAVINTNNKNNGIISIYVVNELASSITDTSIEVNVYMSAGDDFQVQKPNGYLKDLAYARSDRTVGPPASSQSEIITSEENDPNQDTHMVLNGNYCRCDINKNLVYFGEQVVSIRSLLKRYCFHRPLCRDGLAVNTVYSINFIQFNFPNGPGPTYGSSIGSPLTPTATPYNVCTMTYLRWFSQAYIGWRGGIKWKAILVKGQDETGLVKATRISYRVDDEFRTLQTLRGIGVTELDTAIAYLGVNNLNMNAQTMQGAVLNSALVNPAIEYEMPFYSGYRYCEINEPPIGPGIAEIRYQSHYNGGAHNLSMVSRNTNTASYQYLETYCAAGEDFSLFFFIGASPYLFSDAAAQT
jgi:hypothetical protein